MKPKLLYLITEDWFFCSHFFERAIAASESGYEVVVAAREGCHGPRIREAGLRFVPLAFDRRSMNPLREMLLFFKILFLYGRERPDIVHQVAAKPIIYGSVAALLLRVKLIVNAPVGMGYVFSSSDFKARLVRPLLSIAFRCLMNPPGSKVVFENSDDLSDFVSKGSVRPSDVRLIRGAGVDVSRLRPHAEPGGIPVVVLMARMLRDKGVLEFVHAAWKLSDEGVQGRFVLVGKPDPENMASISSEELAAWDGVRGVEYWGWRDDVDAVLEQASVACLPSYREGLPKSLLEAAACGLPIVTTDVPGCREVVLDGENGFLVPARNSNALADALRRLLLDPELRSRMGAAGRRRVEAEFASERIVKETLAVYGALS